MTFTLSQNQEKLRLVLILIGIVAVFAVILPIYSIYKSRQSANRIPSTSHYPPIGSSIKPGTLIPSKEDTEKKQPQNLKEMKQKIITTPVENHAGDLILFKSDFYRISYVPILDVFFVDILRDPASQAKKEAQEWFKNFGLKQEDLCILPVRFGLFNPELKQTNENFSPFPDGCKP